MKLTTKDLMALAVKLAANYKPHKHNLDRSGADSFWAVEDAFTLVSIARKLRHIGELKYNGIARYDHASGMRRASWTEEDEAKAERQSEKLEAKARDILRRYYLKKIDGRNGPVDVEFNGDPRGAMIKFFLKYSGGICL